MATVSEKITHDHRELEEYYNNIINASDDDTRARWQNQFAWALARHSVAEELVVYPAMEENVPNGKEIAEKDRSEHRSVKEALKKFQDMSTSDPEFEPTIKGLMADLSKHIEEEERDDLPALEKHLPTDETQKLAEKFGRTKKFIPTRSHPSAPDKPPFETVLGLMTAPLDKLGDMLRKFPKEGS